MAFLLSGIVPAAADEGMWMINDINEALEKKMKERGLLLGAGEIYNADAPGTSVADAVVSIGFYCTGSVISDKGLIITNHHCAYANIASLSDDEHDYLEEGFWAMTSDQERKIEGESVYFLKRVYDVTDEVKELIDELHSKGQNTGMRKLSSVIEKRYNDYTGLECTLSRMWGGEKYCVSAYKVYDDVRLVAAPPVSIGYFGGDTDNWEWPRHNCDFAIYRIYENGRPVTREKSLTISLNGYQQGSFAMTIGYPAYTNRYSSSAETAFEQNVALPTGNDIRGKQIEIIRKWMEEDPEVRAKYSERFFELCNLHENNVGMLECFKRFNVLGEKEAEERELNEWIQARGTRREIWGSLLEDLSEAYSETAVIEKDKEIFQETLIRGTSLPLFMLRAGNMKNAEDSKRIILEGLDGIDERVEKELLASSLEEVFARLDSYYYGPVLEMLWSRFGENYSGMAEYLWDNSLVSSRSKVEAIDSVGQVNDDLMRRFIMDVKMIEFNQRDGHADKLRHRNDLDRQYDRALYWMRYHNGEAQYPEANSTMRLSYGTVGGYQPIDAVSYSWYTTPAGILEKENPELMDFDLSDREKRLLLQEDWGRWACEVNGQKNCMVVDFLTDNDISGGNSGSPVLNAKGELIGLAFDGNRESLASDAYYTPYYNKCINTDIRFVMWVLDRYAGMKRLIKEMTFGKK